MMTETEELVSRRDALKESLEQARGQVVAREAERAAALGALEEERATLESIVTRLEAELSALETELEPIDEAWATATREAAGAKEHLKGLR